MLCTSCDAERHRQFVATHPECAVPKPTKDTKNGTTQVKQWTAQVVNGASASVSPPLSSSSTAATSASSDVVPKLAQDTKHVTAQVTRKLCYRKDDRAMRHGCPEIFRELLTTPTAIPFERALLSFYRSSIVTFLLSSRVSEILPLLFSSTPLFPYPTSSFSKISPCSPGNRWIAFWLQREKVLG